MRLLMLFGLATFSLVLVLSINIVYQAGYKAGWSARLKLEEERRHAAYEKYGPSLRPVS